jgi:hypothetical protein
MGKWILAIVQQICGKIPNGKKGWENMKKLASAVAILAVLAAPAHAGFRGGGGGFRSSGFRSSGFSRSYSRPSYSSPSRNTTVIQNHNYGGGGMGSSGFLWGYLLGNSGSHAQAPAAPTVVVVPQGGAAAPAISPNVSTVAPIAPTPAPVIEKEPEDGGIGIFGSFLIAIGLGGLVWWLIRRSNNRKGAFA